MDYSTMILVAVVAIALAVAGIVMISPKEEEE